MIWRARIDSQAMGIGGPELNGWRFALGRGHAVGRVLEHIDGCGYDLHVMARLGVDIVLISLLGRQTRVSAGDYRQAISERGLGLKLNDWSLFRRAQQVRRRRLRDEQAVAAAALAVREEAAALEALAQTSISPGERQRPSALAEHHTKA